MLGSARPYFPTGGFMKLTHILLVIFLGCVSAVVTTRYIDSKGTVSQQPVKETVYDRVMRTGTIRCGYVVFDPFVIKDPNTGEMSGIFHDYMEALGKKLSLKIDWSYEYNFATFLTDMNAGKYDLECAGGWPNATRGKYAEYTHPIFYLPLHVYVREGVTKYDNNLQSLNNPDKKFVGIDGEWAVFVHDSTFPKSKLDSLPSMTPLSQIFEEVAANKADALVTDSVFASELMAKRPGLIRQVISSPLTVIPNNLSVPAGEFRFLNMLNTATDELINDGTIERILQKYDLPPDRALRPALPYKEMPVAAKSTP
jgi:ABC-type amino acid transport substrate-binding protein